MLALDDADALMDKVDAAKASLELGNTTSASNQLRAFINQVNALMQGDLSPQAEVLTV